MPYVSTSPLTAKCPNCCAPSKPMQACERCANARGQRLQHLTDYITLANRAERVTVITGQRATPVASELVSQYADYLLATGPDRDNEAAARYYDLRHSMIVKHRNGYWSGSAQCYYAPEVIRSMVYSARKWWLEMTANA